MFETDEKKAETTESKPVETPARETDALVDEWFAKHFHGLGARLDEFLHNHIHAAKEDLKVILGRVHL